MYWRRIASFTHRKGDARSTESHAFGLFKAFAGVKPIKSYWNTVCLRSKEKKSPQWGWWLPLIKSKCFPTPSTYPLLTMTVPPNLLTFFFPIFRRRMLRRTKATKSGRVRWVSAPNIRVYLKMRRFSRFTLEFPSDFKGRSLAPVHSYTLRSACWPYPMRVKLPVWYVERGRDRPSFVCW